MLSLQKGNRNKAMTRTNIAKVICSAVEIMFGCNDLVKESVNSRKTKLFEGSCVLRTE